MSIPLLSDKDYELVKDVTELVFEQKLLLGTSIVGRHQKFPEGCFEMEISRKVLKASDSFTEKILKLKEENAEFVPLVKKAWHARFERWAYTSEGKLVLGTEAHNLQKSCVKKIAALLEIPYEE